MTGLIWFVQVVHYPLFALVGDSAYRNYEAQHTRRTGWVVGVLMPIEATTGLWLAVSPPEAGNSVLFAVGLLLILALWVTTLLVQVPLHRRLLQAHDFDAIRALVRSNWIRTGLWTMRGALLLYAFGPLLVTGP
jgi:hypothetical protein